MMDVCLIGVIVLGCVLVKLFTDWCESQIHPEKKE